MCASCGCGKPNDKHGDDRNITWDEIKAAAEAGHVNTTEAAQNMLGTVKQQAAAGA
jgi:hypothetical protein